METDIRCQSNHQLFFNISQTVVTTVKEINFLNSVIYSINILKQIKIRSSDIPPGQEFLLKKLDPSRPVCSIRFVYKEKRYGITFSCLQQGDCFHCLIKGAKTSREQSNGTGFLKESYFPVKKVFIFNLARVSLHNRVRFLLKGKSDVNAKRMIRSGALINCLHDARSSAGNDHIACFSKFLTKEICHFID